MSEDLKDIIERKIWTVDEAIRQVTKLSNDSKKLPSEAKKHLPIFPGDWSEDKLRNYIEGLQNATKHPIRHKNKILLEGIGVNTKGMQNEVLDDSARIENIIGLHDQLKRSNEKLAHFVVEKENLSKWLRESFEKAETKITELTNAESAFSRIFESGIDDHLIDTLVQKCIEDSEFIDSAEDLISKVEFVNRFDISTKYDDSFDVYCESVDGVSQIIVKLQDEFEIPKEEIGQLVKKKTIDKAKDPLNDRLQDYSRQRDRLVEEWRIYSSAFNSLGGEAPEQPQGFYKLREETKKLKQACREALGGQGMRLIEFLKGEDNFPKKISKKQIQRTLEILRPLFKGALREEI